MLFWIVLGLLSVVTVLVVLLCIVFASSGGDGSLTGSLLLIALWSAFSIFGLAIPWSNHAGDLSKVMAQQGIIEARQDRVDSLSKRLSEFEFPEKANISLDADSPWATITLQLSEAEKDLAEAKEEKQRAIRSIEARRAGPYSGIITIAGDYK